MAQDVHTITAVDWQPALDAIGDIVESLDDIRQCIRIILITPKGSDPHRPEFGCDLWRFLDYPVNEAIPRIVREAMDALRRWEPRIEVIRVVAQIQSPAGVKARVEWRLANRPSSPLQLAEVRI